jgi:uncharacterized phage protein (TIGR01671 family)
MREILFRGKCVHDVEWVYGVPVQWSDGDYQIKSGYANACVSSTINSETIGQYTGIKDKNGKKVFEGDVVLITDDEGNMNFSDGGVGAIEFYDGSWYVSGCPNNGLYDLYKGYEIKVIGNIYDNPELLERKYE